MKNTEHKFIYIIRKIDAAFDYLSKVFVVISGILLVGVTLIISAGVLNRTFTDWAWLFVEEWSSLALVPISYFVFGYTLRRNRHLKMDLVVRRLSKKWRNIFAIFAAVFSLVCLGFMTQSSMRWFLYTLKRNVTSSGPMQTPLWIFSLSILVGLVLFMLDMLMFLINRVLDLKYGDAPLNFDSEMQSDIPDIEGGVGGGIECK